MWGKFHIVVAFGIFTGESIAFGPCVVPGNSTHKPLRDSTFSSFLLFSRAANEAMKIINIPQSSHCGD